MRGEGSPSLVVDPGVAGGTKPMRRWEKWYWGVGVTGVAVVGLTYWNRQMNVEDPEAEAARQAAKEAKRQERVAALRAYLAGKSFLDGPDPFEGLHPQQIAKFMEEYGKGVGASEEDPFEGMSPEEIDEYVRNHGMASVA